MSPPHRVEPPAGSAAVVSTPRPKRTRRSPSRQVKPASASGRDGRLRGGAPGERVPRVVELTPERREPDWAERVPHHRELLGALRPEGLLDKAGLRTVGEARWVQRDRPELDPPARAEVARDVVDRLLALEVGVVVRDGDRLGVVVEFARAER